MAQGVLPSTREWYERASDMQLAPPLRNRCRKTQDGLARGCGAGFGCSDSLRVGPTFSPQEQSSIAAIEHASTATIVSRFDRVLRHLSASTRHACTPCAARLGTERAAEIIDMSQSVHQHVGPTPAPCWQESGLTSLTKSKISRHASVDCLRVLDTPTADSVTSNF